MINVEVIYATLMSQEPIQLALIEGATVDDAIKASGVREIYPELSDKSLVVGIFGEIIHDPSRYCLIEGDRVEIYRPLVMDPKEARRLRASQK